MRKTITLPMTATAVTSAFILFFISSPLWAQSFSSSDRPSARQLQQQKLKQKQQQERLTRGPQSKTPATTALPRSHSAVRGTDNSASALDRRLAQETSGSSRSFEAVNIHYAHQAGSPQPLQQVSLNLTPFGNYISFYVAAAQKQQKPIQIHMDCHVAKDYMSWNCLSACEAGSVSIGFHENASFEQIRIAPFKIKARSCGDDPSDSDRLIQSARPMVMQIDKMRMHQ